MSASQHYTYLDYLFCAKEAVCRWLNRMSHMNSRRTWTWGNWCSRCAICPRLAGSPSPWSKREISRPWTSQELQVGFGKHSGETRIANSFPIIPGWPQPRFLGQIHTSKCPWCAKAGGWRRERRRQSGTLWTPCTTRPSCLTFLQRTLTRSASSSPSWTTIGRYSSSLASRRVFTPLTRFHYVFFGLQGWTQWSDRSVQGGERGREPGTGPLEWDADIPAQTDRTLAPTDRGTDWFIPSTFHTQRWWAGGKAVDLSRQIRANSPGEIKLG